MSAFDLLPIRLPHAASVRLGIGPRAGVLLRKGSRLGEASPLPGRSRESLEEVLTAIRAGAHGELASIDFALWSLDADRETTPIRSQVLLEDASHAVEAARAALGAGARAFKLKIRSSDEALVLAELRSLAPEAVLRVDANRAFAHAREVPWDALSRASVAWIEEPCPNAGALEGVPVPIALDESVVECPERALADLAEGRVAALVLKPTILGARETLRVGHEARRRGGRVVVSHAFESEVARRSAEELARRIDPHETHGLARWTGLEGFCLENGSLVVALLDPERLDPERLDERDARHADSAMG